MYGSRIDPAHGLLVGLFSGSSNDEGDFERYVQSILDADRQTRPETASVAVLIVDRENPPPDARWRKRIADATASIRTEGALFLLCAESPVIRGVMTAINWIRPPKYEVRILATPEAVFATVGERRASARSEAERMFRELRAASGRK